jgi:hypothetical protein
LAGFAALFGLYHAAEYMILFNNSPAGFLAFQALFFLAAWAIARWQAKPGLAISQPPCAGKPIGYGPMTIDFPGPSG